MPNFNQIINGEDEGLHPLSSTPKNRNETTCDESMPFTDRLKEVIGEKSLRQFARQCNVSSSALRQYFNGKSEPTRPVLMRIANAADVSVEWLVTGRGHMKTGNGQGTGALHIKAGNLFSDILKVDGNEVPTQASQVSDDLMFKRQWLCDEIGTDPANLMLVKAPDDSMEPMIRQGDHALVDMSSNKVVNDAVYAIMVDDRIIIKRVQLMLFDSMHLQVISDNPVYKSQVIRQEDMKSFRVIGRVVWSGRKW